MSRGVAVLPARGSREELVGRSIEEWSIARSGCPSARTRSGPRSNRRSFSAQGKVGRILTDGGGEAFVWSCSNRLLVDLAVVNVHPEIGRKRGERGGNGRAQIWGLDRTHALVPVGGKHVDGRTNALVVPERNAAPTRRGVQPS